MSASFPRTLRALQRDGMNPTLLGLMLIAVLLVFWCCWLFAGRVSIYETSAGARLEVERVHPVTAVGGGRIVASNLSLGREVQSGDVLLEIEAERESLETAQERTRLDGLTSQLAAIEQEIASEQQDVPLARRTARIRRSQAIQNLATSEAASRLAEDEQRRLRQLSERGLVSEADVVRGRIQAESRRAEAAAARLGIERLGAEEAAAEREHDGHLRSLIRQRVTLEGEKATAAAAVALREWDANEAQIRAPISGRLGDITALQVGALIKPGERVASIVPSGHVKVVAEFPASALGRLRVGQSARLRLDGFPWAQYGDIRAIVERVGSETREGGRVRVELAVANSSSGRVALEHGLPGVVDIEIERVAPIALLVRTLGATRATLRTSVESEPAAEHAAR